MRRFLLALVVVPFFAYNGLGITLSGQVMSPDGKTPAKGITAQAEHHENRHAQSPDDFVMKKVTGDDGRFSLDLPDTKQEYMLFLADEKGHVFTGYAHVGATTNYGTIALQRGCSLSGAVRDKDGKPIPDIEVVLDLRLQKYTCTHYLEAARTRTNAKGEFAFSDLSPAEYGYRIVSAAYAAKNGKCEVSDDPSYVEIRAEMPATIKGLVTDEQGKPVAGIKVTAGPGLSADSDAQGNYVIKGLSEGQLSLSASGKGYVVKEGRTLAVSCSKGAEVVRNIEMVHAGALKLQLEPEEPGVTVPGHLNIHLESPRGSSGGYASQYAEAKVESNVAVFSNVAPGKYTLRIANEDVGQVSTNVTIIGGQETQQALKLAKVLVVTGKIIDEKGNPVSGASVALQLVQEKDAGKPRRARVPAVDEWKHASSDAKGEFKVGGLKPGKRDVTVSHQDYASTNRVVDIVEGKLTLEPFVVTKGLQISGSVLEADGKPAQNTEVLATYEFTALTSRQTMRRSFSGLKRAELAEDGSFRISGLDSGKYKLQITDTESRQTEATLEGVEAGTDDVMVSLSRKRVITGAVVDADGKALKGVRFQVTKQQGGQTISFSSSRTSGEDANVTDVGGKFSLTVREGAKYVITFTSPPLLPQKAIVDLSPGSKPPEPLKIVMMPGYKVTGAVVGGQGKPVAGLTVRASSGGYEGMFTGMSEDSEGQGGGEPKPTDAQGRFLIDGVPAGVVKLNVFSKTNDQQKMIASKEVMVAKDKPTDVEIRLPEMGSVKGRVVDAEGKPMEGCQITLMSPLNPASHHSAQSGEDGEFAIADVAAGKYMAMWFDMRSGSYTPSAPVAVEVTAGKTTEVSLSPKKAAAGAMTVSGVIKKEIMYSCPHCDSILGFGFFLGGLLTHRP